MRRNDSQCYCFERWPHLSSDERLGTIWRTHVDFTPWRPFQWRAIFDVSNWYQTINWYWKSMTNRWLSFLWYMIDWLSVFPTDFIDNRWQSIRLGMFSCDYRLVIDWPMPIDTNWLILSIGIDWLIGFPMIDCHWFNMLGATAMNNWMCNWGCRY